MHRLMRGLLARKKLFSSASAERRKKEQDCYLKNGSSVLEELLALCDGNCRIPIRYFTAIEIERAIKHSEKKIELDEGYMVNGWLDNRLVLIRFYYRSYASPFFSSYSIHRDIAVTAQMSHLKNVLRLVGCCLEFEEPVTVYEYVEAISLDELLFNKGNINDHARKSLLSWGSRLRIANEVASAIVFLHTEFTTPIIHRDIKPNKVIIDQKRGIAKIVDFSCSISLPPGELEVEASVCGTFGYADPEYVSLGIATQKIDVFSFGIVLFQLLTGKKLRDIMESNIREGNVMDRVDSAISEEIKDFEEDADMNSTMLVKTLIYSEEAAESNIEKGNIMDRMDSKIPEGLINFENPSMNAVHHFIEKNNDVMDIADPTILEERGIEIRQQLEDYLNLVKKCIAYRGEERPYMIQVAKELLRIHKCFRTLTLGQN